MQNWECMGLGRRLITDEENDLQGKLYIKPRDDHYGQKGEGTDCAEKRCMNHGLSCVNYISEVLINWHACD